VALTDAVVDGVGATAWPGATAVTYQVEFSGSAPVDRYTSPAPAWPKKPAAQPKFSWPATEVSARPAYEALAELLRSQNRPVPPPTGTHDQEASAAMGVGAILMRPSCGPQVEGTR
jgi:hypothetical protein